MDEQELEKVINAKKVEIDKNIHSLNFDGLWVSQRYELEQKTLSLRVDLRNFLLEHCPQHELLQDNRYWTELYYR